MAGDRTAEDRGPQRTEAGTPLLGRALAGLHALVGVLTPDGVAVEADGSALRAADLTRADVIGRPLDEMPWWSRCPAIRVRLRAAVARARGGEPVRMAVSARLGGGDRLVDLDLDLVPLTDDAGRVTHLAVAASDAGGRRRPEGARPRADAESERRVEAGTRAPIAAEEALEREVAERRRAEEHHARLGAILEATPDLVSTATPDGQVLYFNGAARRVLGLPERGDLPEWRIARGHPAWALELIRSEGIPTAMRDGYWRGEAAVLGHDGREIPVSQVIIAHRDPDGAVAYLSTIARDISERQRAEEALRMRGDRLQLLSDAAAELLATGDPKGMVLRLFRRVAEQLDLDVYFSFMLNEAGDALYLDSYAGVPDDTARSLARLEFGQAICGTAAQTGRPIYASDIQRSDDPKVQLVKGFGIRAYACNPLMAGDRLLGTLSFATRSRDRFSEEDLAFFRTISHYVALVHDRLQAERAVREAAEQRRLALEAADLGTWDYDLVAGRFHWDERCRRIHGVASDDGPLSFERAVATVHPDDRARVVRAFDEAINPESSGEYRVEKRVVWPDGSIRWVIARGEVHFEGEGAERRAVRMVGAAMDATERKLTEERQDLLLAELDHRVKNMLASVQSLVVRTSAGSPEDFSTALQGRIQAMAHAHSLLTRSRWQGASLRAIVAEELQPFFARDGRNGRIAGPDLVLTPKAALALSMAVHELTTNAAKYGALSVPEGRVEVTWGVVRGAEAGGGGPLLTLRWAERGGPRVGPPRHRGFGCTVIERSLAYEVDGEARLDFAPEGVTCEIAIPLDQLVERDAGPGRPADPAAAGAAPIRLLPGEVAARRILVVEDSLLVAMEVEAAVRANGWQVVGPANRLTRALRLARAEDLDGAVLDINLDGVEVYEVADALLERGVPFVFATGYDASSVLPAKHRDRPTLRKPFTAGDLREALRRAFA
ncbi:MAG TPA: HWE histidine kinase domain-containing protein [Geminicoccaceae bacterium]|nr:HWE histidine kinase domain-containing protein [Geminicoccaceae bacterium]